MVKDIIDNKLIIGNMQIPLLATEEKPLRISYRYMFGEAVHELNQRQEAHLLRRYLINELAPTPYNAKRTCVNRAGIHICPEKLGVELLKMHQCYDSDKQLNCFEAYCAGHFSTADEQKPLSLKEDLWQVLAPNFAISLSGIWIAMLSYGMWGWISSWDNQNQVIRFLIIGAIGLIVCALPFVLQKGGRRLIGKILSNKNVLKPLAFGIAVWIFAIMAKYDAGDGYLVELIKSGCAVLSVLSCLVGIVAGIIIFFAVGTSIGQDKVGKLWDDTTPTERD